MKKVLMILVAIVFAATANAQYYNVGTSTTTTDYFGNQTTTHRNQYGQTTGTSTSSTDYFGNRTTTHRDQYGVTNMVTRRAQHVLTQITLATPTPRILILMDVLQEHLPDQRTISAILQRPIVTSMVRHKAHLPHPTTTSAIATRSSAAIIQIRPSGRGREERCMM